jgi:hypothetical protein
MFASEGNTSKLKSNEDAYAHEKQQNASARQGCMEVYPQTSDYTSVEQC